MPHKLFGQLCEAIEKVFKCSETVLKSFNKLQDHEIEKQKFSIDALLKLIKWMFIKQERD